jgi:hypothetical protein
VWLTLSSRTKPPGVSERRATWTFTARPFARAILDGVAKAVAVNGGVVTSTVRVWGTSILPALSVD